MRVMKGATDGPHFFITIVKLPATDQEIYVGLNYKTAFYISGTPGGVFDKYFIVFLKPHDYGTESERGLMR